MQEVQILAWAHQKKENNLLSQLSALEFTFSGLVQQQCTADPWQCTELSSLWSPSTHTSNPVLPWDAVSSKPAGFEFWGSSTLGKLMSEWENGIKASPSRTGKSSPCFETSSCLCWHNEFRAMKLLEFSSFCYSESWTKSWQALTKKLRILDWESILLLLFLLLNQGLACTREFTKISFPK